MPTPVPKTAEAIQAEIDALTRMKPNVKQYSFFREDHHAAIDAQIHVLSHRMSIDAVHERYEAAPGNVFDAAADASDWMSGLQDAEMLSPSNDWSTLVH